MPSQEFNKPLIYTYLPSSIKLSTIQNILFVALGTGLLTLSAKIQIPFWPVPTSLQSFTVVLLAALLGHRLGTATILLYLLEGAFGLPVFVNNTNQVIGLAYFVGPTAGYLLGFILAAYGVGVLSEKQWGKTPFSALKLFFIGLLIIEVPGVLWLSYLFGLEKALTIAGTYQLASVFKIGLGAGILSLLWRRKVNNTKN